MNTLNIVLIVLGVIAFYVILAYNSLIRKHNRVHEALSDIDVQLKRRYDLIPNLVEIVRGYMQHEKGVLENVVKARASLGFATGSPLERDQAENQLSATLKTLFAVSEGYPDLKANTNFLELQREISDTEDKIQAARRFYNSMAMDMNTKMQTFPTNLMAKTLGFHEERFFEAGSETEKQPVQVKF